MNQFRDDEAVEFRELQKELEATAKNCRILQFKLRKLERRNEQGEADRMQVRKDWGLVTLKQRLRQITHDRQACQMEKVYIMN